ncbi:hypothetical protein AOLI_G00208860 [Acnodon oligacanthus]
MAYNTRAARSHYGGVRKVASGGGVLQCLGDRLLLRIGGGGGEGGSRLAPAGQEVGAEGTVEWRRRNRGRGRQSGGELNVPASRAPLLPQVPYGQSSPVPLAWVWRKARPAQSGPEEALAQEDVEDLRESNTCQGTARFREEPQGGTANSPLIALDSTHHFHLLKG